jgi:hypothetical protein
MANVDEAQRLLACDDGQIARFTTATECVTRERSDRRWSSAGILAVFVVCMFCVVIASFVDLKRMMATTHHSISKHSIQSLSTNGMFVLNVDVTDRHVQTSISVNQESHVGYVMLEIVEKLDVTSDFSDHALWWPEKQIWLSKARASLYTYGIAHDTQLLFTPQHKSIRLQMPDLEYTDLNVNFAVDVFHSVAEICSELGIRHPEELSLARPLASPGQNPIRMVSQANFNAGWLSSAESLMQQDVIEYDTLVLRFKYYNFFDLNPKVDDVRITQIYGQALWQVLVGEIQCTDEEAFTFAALQFQVKKAPPLGQVDQADEVDNALSELSQMLEGGRGDEARFESSHIPEMEDQLELVKRKSLGVKSVKKYWFVFKDTHIAYFKNPGDVPINKVNLKGSEVTPKVNVAKAQYHISLRVPAADVVELEIVCPSEESYIKWMAACRLASKGKTMADPSYDMEMARVRTFLSMQSNGDQMADVLMNPGDTPMNPEEFVPTTILSNYKPKQVVARILEAHASFTKLGHLEAKMRYIRQWQSLPSYGVTYFNAEFQKKSGFVGIATSKIMRIDANSVEMKSWSYNSMKNWNVNWETREMIISFEGDVVIFSLIGCDVKIVHEFIGGYIFLSMRKDVNAPLDFEMFYKLTGGWNTIGGGEGKSW